MVVVTQIYYQRLVQIRQKCLAIHVVYESRWETRGMHASFPTVVLQPQHPYQDSKRQPYHIAAIKQRMNFIYFGKRILIVQLVEYIVENMHNLRFVLHVLLHHSKNSSMSQEKVQPHCLVQILLIARSFKDQKFCLQSKSSQFFSYYSSLWTMWFVEQWTTVKRTTRIAKLALSRLPFLLRMHPFIRGGVDTSSTVPNGSITLRSLNFCGGLKGRKHDFWLWP